MRKSLARLALAAAALSPLPACFTFTHTVGRGPQNVTPVVATETEWFALWGLVPLDPVDSATLAGPTRDYRVTTKFTVVDVLISAFSSFVTLYRQTVVVEK
jgi:hypothetical protein